MRLELGFPKVQARIYTSILLHVGLGVRGTAGSYISGFLYLFCYHWLLGAFSLTNNCSPFCRYISKK